jgi:hypothetical protein
MRTARGSLSTAWCTDERAPPRRAILNAWPNFRYWPKTTLRPISIHRARRTYSTLAPALNGSSPFEVSLRKVKPLSVGSIVIDLLQQVKALVDAAFDRHQRFVRPLFGQTTVIEHDDAVGGADRRQAVCDRNDGHAA